MNRFYVWHWQRIKRITIIIGLALLTALFIWFGRDGALSLFQSRESTALIKGNVKAENIALTFNISWGEERADQILDNLKKHQVQATFFISGEWAQRHPDILKKITEGKHEIAMLGYRYNSYLDQNIEDVRKDLALANDTFKKLGYTDIHLLRTPNGHFNKEIIKLCDSLNFDVIHWSVNSHDWKNPGTEVIIDNVMKETKNGDIILMHASDSAKQTAKALDTILPGLKNKKYKFVTISELKSEAHAKSKIVD